MNGATHSLPARISRLLSILRPTPLLPLEVAGVRVHAKLEYLNPVGSLKDRPALWILRAAAERGELTESSTIVESSSGNFACALATYARLLNLNFVPVIDPNISPYYETILRSLCRRVVKVEERDDTGGFLKTRLRRLEQLRQELPGAFWPNQYGNPDAAAAHYHLTGAEICQQAPALDYVFLGVSTGGTIAGVSKRLRESMPRCKVIAVDAAGSVIFGGPPRKRHIPGIGSSIRPPLVESAAVDDVVMVAEADTAAACRELLEHHGLFAGGSTGSAFAAIRQYLPRISKPQASVLFLAADRGTPYVETVFNDDWSKRLE